MGLKGGVHGEEEQPSVTMAPKADLKPRRKRHRTEAERNRRASREEQGWNKAQPLTLTKAPWPEARLARAALRRKRRAAESERRAGAHKHVPHAEPARKVRDGFRMPRAAGPNGERRVPGNRKRKARARA